MARQPSCFLDRFCLLTATISFFLKAPGALGSHVRFLDAHANQTQRRRDCLSSLGTRHTEDAHHHTHPAHMHTASIPRCERGSNPRRYTPSAGVTTAPEAYPHN